MPKATDTPTTTRRAALGTGVALLIGAPAVAGAAVEPDAELIRLCRKFDGLERHAEAHFHGPAMVEDDDERAEALQPVWDQQSDLLDRICAITAVTLAGFAARAATLAGYDEFALAGKDDESWSQRMRYALIRDLVAI